MLDPKYLCEEIYSEKNQEILSNARLRYEIYNGKLKDKIKKAIEKEFALPETVKEMSDRIVPINIVSKIVNKLAGVYIEEPIRESLSGNEQDTQNIETFKSISKLDISMKSLNRYFKLNKASLVEIYLSKAGVPSTRALPRHTYTLFSDDMIDTNRPTAIVKHLKLSNEKKNDLHIYWDDFNHFTFNGEGQVLVDSNNPDMINPYQTMPFVYVNESQDLLNPIQNDDLISVQYAINLLLTDLNLASKYSTFSVLYTIGCDASKISFNPSSVISLPIDPVTGQKPEIGTIKTNFDSDAILRQVENLVAMLLTTNSLSVRTVSGSSLSSSDAASGVAKILDQSESTEDREDQESFFINAEKELFQKLSKNIMPYWIESKTVDPKYALVFSNDFDISVKFPTQQPVVSESEIVDNEIKKLNNGLTSKQMAIKTINPEFTQDEVSQVLLEIEKEKQAEIEVAMQPEMIEEIDKEDSNQEMM